MNFRLSIIIIFTAVIMVQPLLVFAQSDSTPADQTAAIDTLQKSPIGYAATVNEGDVDTILNPEFPGAFQQVRIRLDSNTIDLNRYTIKWIVDGVQAQSGVGLRDITVRTKNYGEGMAISASINLGGQTIQKNIFLSPQDATVLWEAIDSSVPPFYRGKKLPGREALIRISGISNFQPKSSSLALNDGVYIWSRNANRILGVGGYAKNSITIEQNRLRESETITALISNTAGNAKTEKTVVIPAFIPEVHLYTRTEQNYRRLSSVDRGLRIFGGDTSLVAEPYFFSLNNRLSDLTYSWKVNDETVYLDPDAPGNELLVRNPNETGQSNFQVSVENPKTFLQSAARSLSLYFQ